MFRHSQFKGLNRHMFLSSLASVFTSLVPLSPSPAYALPFARSCASLQNYLNALPWDNPTKIHGFENKTFNWSDNDGAVTYHCNRGYVTINDPRGTEVCIADIWYSEPDRSKGISISDWRHCRFK